jgi:hypothetical protein
MGPFNRNSLLLILCLLLPGSAFAWPKTLPKKDISLSFYSGITPFTVRIIGPLDLVAQAVGYPEKFVWCGYRVSWGDGANTDFYKQYKRGAQESSCTSGLEHVYQKLGTFSVKVIKFHTGPNNKITNDWVGRTKVIVKQQEPIL